MHFVKAKSLLNSSNNMNIFRGCEHGCIYCDSRSKCYHIEHEFSDISVKENAIELLEEILKRKRKKCMISTGSMSDSYTCSEASLKYTYKVLELIYKYGFGISLMTKSSLITRDIELIDKINKRSKAIVQMTLTTYDDSLCKIIEPNVSVSSSRFNTLVKFRNKMIPTIVWLCPFLPLINDTLSNIKGLLNYIIKSGVRGVLYFGCCLTLREGNREYYYENLDKYFPGLKDKYIKYYNNSYVLKSNNSKVIDDYVYKTCKENNIMINNDDVFKYINTLDNNNNNNNNSLDNLTLFDSIYDDINNNVILVDNKEITLKEYLNYSSASFVNLLDLFTKYKLNRVALNYLVNLITSNKNHTFYIDINDTSVFESIKEIVYCSNIVINIIVKSNNYKYMLSTLNRYPLNHLNITFNLLNNKIVELNNYLYNVNNNYYELILKCELNDEIIDYSNILSIRNECVKNNVSFTFFNTPLLLKKDNKVYKIKRELVSVQASKASINYVRNT